MDDAYIEIVSPVLKKGKTKWKGIYNQESISFSIHDADFLDGVYTRKVSFSNGSAIRCLLQEKRKINDKGEEVISGYEVLEVHELQLNGTPQSLPARKKKTQASSEQLTLFPEYYDQA